MIEYINSELYNSDSTYKQIIISYDDGEITNSDLHFEQFELEEAICTEQTLKFGSCEAAKISFRIVNPFESLLEKSIVVSNVLDKDVENPFQIGVYKIYSDVPSADRKYRDVTAYDAMYDIINADVTDWYDSMFEDDTSTITLKEFRNAFISYFGLEEEEIDLVNDEMVVSKTISGTGITGKLIINAICEINGCFGNIGRNGKFRYVYLIEKSEEIFPSNDLYPSDDIFPLGTNAIEFSRRRYKGSPTYEDFKVQKISKLQIRMEENDIGVIVGDGDNTYVIQDNFLVYGMSTEELTQIAENILNAIKVVEYRPAAVKAIGNPCVEVGDLVRINTKTINIDTYVLKRVLSGIQVITDAYTATGEEIYSYVENGTSGEIRKLKAQSNVLKRTIEGTVSEVSKISTSLKNDYSTTEEMKTAISQTAESVKTDISKTYTTKTEFEEEIKSIQDQIVGTLDSYSGSEIPTLENYPANEWTTDLLKDAAIGSLYFVNSENGEYAGSTYRFEKLGDGTYQWTLLQDSEVTQALKELEELRNNLSGNYTTTVKMNLAIEQSASGVKQEVSETYATKNALSGVEEVVKSNSSAIDQNAKSIELRVKEEDITGNYLVTKINLDSTTAKITAKNIVLEGLVTANENFMVLEDGSIEANNGLFNGKMISHSDERTCYINDGQIVLFPERVEEPEIYEGDDYSIIAYNNLFIHGPGYFEQAVTASRGINVDVYGNGLKWDTTFGEAGIASLSSGSGIYLFKQNADSDGWDSTILLADKDGVNLVPKTGGSFSGDITAPNIGKIYTSSASNVAATGGTWTVACWKTIDAGTYVVVGEITFEADGSSEGTGRRTIAINNGTTHLSITAYKAIATTHRISTTAIVEVSASEIIGVHGWQNGADELNISSARLTAVRIK